MGYFKSGPPNNKGIDKVRIFSNIKKKVNWPNRYERGNQFSEVNSGFAGKDIP